MQNYNNYLDCERLKGEQKTLHLDRGHKKRRNPIYIINIETATLKSIV